MAVMLAKTYAAFEAAGIGDDQAQAAAEELASFESRFMSIDSGISRMDGKMSAIEGRMKALKRRCQPSKASSPSCSGLSG